MVANHEKILIIIKLTFQKKLILINPKKKKKMKAMYDFSLLLLFRYKFYRSTRSM